MSDDAPRPYTLVAELTYRCPLRCVYCSNPLDYASHRDGLSTADWLRVFREAEALGVVQLNLTGGEPLLRDDLEALVEGARALDLYTNLITSGIPCTRETVADRTYPALTQLGFVTRGAPKGRVARFIRWVRTSGKARRVIATRYVPARASS